jgi:hypothetical protein
MPGPNIIVSGAVFADKIITQTLTDYISVIPRPNRNNRSPFDDAGYRIAHLFRALKECINDLEVYYSQLVGMMYYPPPVIPTSGVFGGRRRACFPPGAFRTLAPPSFIGPHFTTYHDSEGEEVVLTYRARLQPNLPMKAVFVAEAKRRSGIEKVVVKFAYTYNREAHELLANAEPSQAPRLRYCAFEPSVGMWVVVMDYVESSEVGVDEVLKESNHIESFRAALDKLHSRGLVFGDLRPPNVLIVGDKVMLIDFDWCGKAGQARYPSDIILQEGVWHREVQRGGLMTQAHDEYHFQKLTWPMNKDHSLVSRTTDARNSWLEMLMKRLSEEMNVTLSSERGGAVSRCFRWSSASEGGPFAFSGYYPFDLCTQCSAFGVKLWNRSLSRSGLLFPPRHGGVTCGGVSLNSTATGRGGYNS